MCSRSQDVHRSRSAMAISINPSRVWREIATYTTYHLSTYIGKERCILGNILAVIGLTVQVCTLKPTLEIYCKIQSIIIPWDMLLQEYCEQVLKVVPVSMSGREALRTFGFVVEGIFLVSWLYVYILYSVHVQLCI